MKLRKLITALALAVGFTTAATAAPAPVAVWDGDFSTTLKIGTDAVAYTLDRRGNDLTVDNCIQISQTVGAKIEIGAPATFGGVGAVLVKYSGLVVPASGQYAIVGAKDTSSDSGYYFGAYMKAAGSAALSGYFEGGTKAFAFANDPTPAASGYLLFTYSTSSGTSCYVGESLASLAGGCASGLHWSSKNLAAFYLGGNNSAQADGYRFSAWSGLKIEKVAIFKNCFYSGATVTDFADYKWPSDTRKIISVNIANDTGTTLAVQDADSIVTPLGTLAGTAWQNVGDTTTGSERTGSVTGVKAWDGSAATTFSDVTVAWTTTSGGFANMLDTAGDKAKILRTCYNRMSGSSIDNATITVTGLANHMTAYDVLVYVSCNANLSNAKATRPIYVNGTAYYADSTAVPYGTTEGTSTSWGALTTTAVEYGKNAIRVCGLKGDLTLNIAESHEKWGFASFQIIESDYVPPATATIPANANITWANIPWDGGVAPTAGKAVELTLEGDATITVDAAAACDAITAAGTGTLTLDAGDNLACSKITSEIPLVITTAKNQTVNAGANDLTYNYTGASEITPNVTYSGNFTKGGTGTVALSHNVPSGKTLTVSEGTLKLTTSGQGIVGTVVVAAGATLENGTTDGLCYSGNSPRLDIYGTLAMGTTRWTMNNNVTYNFYAGSTVTGTGNNSPVRAFDMYNGVSTFNFKKNGDQGGTVNFNVQTWMRNVNLAFNIEDGVTVSVGNKVYQQGTRTVTQSGAGTLLLAANGNINFTTFNVTAGTFKPTAGTVNSSATVNMSGTSVLDLSALSTTAADIVAGSLTVADTVAIRFPAGFEENAAFTLCGGTLTASEKVANATVYVGDSATPVENATLVYDAENKTVAYATSLPGTIVITGAAVDVDAIDAAILAKEGEGYTGDVMLTIDADATLTIDKAFAYSGLYITSAGAATLNYALDAADTFGKIHLTGIAGDWTITTALNLPVDAGTRNLTYNYTGAEPITNENLTVGGTFTKGGTGTMFVNLGGSRTAATVVAAGKLCYQAQYALGSGSAVSITVNNGATLDFNGYPNNGQPNITLAGGTLANTVDRGGGVTGQMQILSLTLTADSTIDATCEFGLIGGGYKATTVNLDTYTLTKAGAGTFHIINTGINGTGKIRVTEGTFDVVQKGCVFSEGTFELAGGTLSRNAAFTVNAVTVVADSAITGSGNLTAPITVSDEATLDCTAIALPIAGASLAAAQNGTLKITTPAAPSKIAAAAETVEDLTLVDADGNALDAFTQDGFFWYGKAGDTYALTDDDKTAIAAMGVGPIFTKQTLYPGLTTVAGTPEGYFGWTEGTKVYVAKKSDSISIKFGPRGTDSGTIATTDASVGGYPVAGKFWNHSKIYTDTKKGTSEIFPLKDGNGAELDDVLCYYYAPNTYWSSSAQTTGNGKLTKTYFDDCNRTTPTAWPYSVGTYNEREYVLPETPTKEGVTTNLRWEVAITNIPYQVFDLYLYQASDQTGSNIKLMSLAVKANDGEWKYFAGDNAGSTVPATYDTVWNGAPYCDDAEMVEGTHYIRYRISKAALGLGDGEEISVVYLSQPAVHNSARLGLAGMQIVLVENDGYYTRKADAGADWLAENSWLNSSKKDTSWANPSGKDVSYATIDGDEVSTININGEIHANEVTLVNTEEGTFTFTRSNEGTLTAPIDATGFHGKIVLCEGMTSAIALGSDAHIEVTIPANETVSLADILPSGITVDPASAVTIKGAGTLVCDGAFPSAYAASFQDEENWTGTVWLKNVATSGDSAPFANYCNANSKIKVTGVTGWLRHTPGDQGVADMELADDGETLALEITDSSQTKIYSFAKFTGSGSFRFATKATTGCAMVLNDVSDFTGKLLSTAGSETTARPIYIGSSGTANLDSLISVADGATINSGCGWQAATAAFGATLVVKGADGDTVVGGLTTEPDLNTAVTLKDRTTGETTEGDYCLMYEDGAVKVAKYVTFAAPTVEGASTVTVTGGKIAGGTVTAYVGKPLTVTYTADEGKLFKDGTNTKVINIASVTTGEAAKEAVETALEDDEPTDGKAKIGTTYYLTFAAAVEAANGMASATVEPLVDATVEADMTVNETVSFNIKEAITLTLKKGGFKASQFTNYGTIAVVGGTVAEPIALTGNANFGVMTLGEDTYVKNTVDGNHVHIVTGAGATSCYALGKESGGVGFTTAAFTNLTLISDCAEGERVWMERMTYKDLRLVANTMFYLAEVSPTVLSLSGAGSITKNGDKTLTVNPESACEYSGETAVPFTIGGTEKVTLSGNYTGALTVNDGATVELGAAAIPSSITALGDATILAKDGAKLTLTGAITGALTLDESVSNVTFGANRSFGTSLDFEADAANVAFVENIADDGVMPALPLAGGSTVPAAKMFGADGVEKEVTGGKFAPSVSGGVCLLDYTFTNTVQTTGGKEVAPAGTSQQTGNLTGDNNTSYTNFNEVTGWYEALHTKVRPYRDYQLTKPFSVAVAGCFPSSNKTVLVSFGSSVSCLFLASGAEADKVELVRVNGHCPQANNRFNIDNCTVLTTMNVPNAATTLHSVVFETTDLKTIDIYLDGVKWSTYTFEQAQTIGSGIQVGGWYGGSAYDDCYHQANDTTAPDSYVSAIRLYGAALGPNAVAALADEFQYISPNGSYSRTLAADPTAWWQAGQAWKNDMTEELVDAPAAGAAVKITGTAATTVAVNLKEDTTYEAITFNGASDKALTFTTNTLTGWAGKIKASGQVQVFSPVSLDYAAIDISGVPLTIGENGMLVLDARSIDYASYYADTFIPLTGMTSFDYYPDKLAFAQLPTVPGRTLAIGYNSGAQTFGVNVTMKGELTGTVAAGSTFESIVWTMGGDTVTPDWTKIKAAKLVPAEGATLAFGSEDLSGLTFTLTGENAITFTSEAPVAADIVLQNGAKVTALDGTFAVAADGTVAADGELSLKAGTLKSAGSAIDAIAFAAATAIELHGENTVTAATVAGNVDWLVKDGTTTLGFDMRDNTAIITGANIVIDEGATLVAQTIQASYGYRGLTIDGTLKATKFSRPMSGNITLFSETGVLDVGTLGYGNWSAQTFALKEVRIGAGGIVCDNANHASLAFSNTTVKATADWTTTCAFALSGDTAFDTASFTNTLNGAVTGTGTLTKRGAGMLKVANVAAATPVRIEAGVLDLGGVRDLTIGGAGTVNGTLTDAEFNAGAVVLFNKAAGASTAIGKITYGAKDITSKCTVSEDGTSITAIEREAKIGTTYYLTLQDAVNAGGDIVVLKDITLAARVDVAKDATIDLNGKTVTRPDGSYAGNGSAFDVKSGAVTIRNGAIDLSNLTQTAEQGAAAQNECDAITARAGASVTLEDLTVTVDSISGSCAYAFSPNALITIKSGTYENKTTADYPFAAGFKALTLNQANVAEQLVVAEGGTFVGQNPATGDDKGLCTTFLAADRWSVKTDDGWVVTDEQPEAKIGTVFYVTLQEAVDAGAGETVEVCRDITLVERVNVKVSTTIDLGGFTVKSSETCGNGSAFDIQDGAVVAIQNGMIDGTDVTSKECDAIVVRNGTLNLADGLTVLIDTKDGACVYAFANGLANISGGTYDNQTLEDYTWVKGIKGMPLNQANDMAQLITVTGGRFRQYNPANGDDSGNPSTFLAANCYSAKSGEYWVVTDAPAAKIGTVYYLTLADAFGDVKANETVTLLADIAEAVVYTGAVDFTFDLNGQTLSSATATATLKNNGTGKITIVATNGGKIANSVNAVDRGIALWARTGAITVEAGTFESNSKYEATVYAQSAAVVINGGTFNNLCAEQYAYGDLYHLALNRQNGGTGSITVYGGTFSSDPAKGDDSKNPPTFVADKYYSAADGANWTVQAMLKYYAELYVDGAKLGWGTSLGTNGGYYAKNVDVLVKESGVRTGVNPQAPEKTYFVSKLVLNGDPAQVWLLSYNGTELSVTNGTSAVQVVDKTNLTYTVTTGDLDCFGQVWFSEYKDQGVVPEQGTPIVADSLEEAQAKASQMTVKLSDDATAAAGDQAADVTAMLEVTAKEVTPGNYVTEVVFKDSATNEVAEAATVVETALAAQNEDLTADTLTVTLTTGEDIVPGLYYGIVAESSLDLLATKQPKAWELATQGGVSLSADKPAGDKAFYRVVCSPAPKGDYQ